MMLIVIFLSLKVRAILYGGQDIETLRTSDDVFIITGTSVSTNFQLMLTEPSASNVEVQCCFEYC